MFNNLKQATYNGYLDKSLKEFVLFLPLVDLVVVGFCSIAKSIFKTSEESLDLVTLGTVEQNRPLVTYQIGED